MSEPAAQAKREHEENYIYKVIKNKNNIKDQ